MYTMLYVCIEQLQTQRIWAFKKYFENPAETAKRKSKELDTTIYILDSDLVWRMQLMIIKG